MKLELSRNQTETHQLLTAAEHLETQNNYNNQMVAKLQKEKEELQKYIESIEEDNKKYLETLVKHSKGYETKDLLKDL